MFKTDYKYEAFCFRVIDGDTFEAFVLLQDYGFRKYEMAKERFRLAEIDTWEMHGDQKPKGLSAKARTEELILHKWINLETKKDPGKYGRWIVKVTSPELLKLYENNQISGLYLHEILRSEGHEKII